MTANEHSLRSPDGCFEILKLVETQIISVEEGTRLLEALDRSEQDTLSHVSSRLHKNSFSSSTRDSFGGTIRIRITEIACGDTKVDLVLPAGLVDAGIKLTRRFTPETVFDIRDIRKSLANGYRGSLIDVINNAYRIEITAENSDPHQPGNHRATFD